MLIDRNIYYSLYFMTGLKEVERGLLNRNVTSLDLGFFLNDWPQTFYLFRLLINENKQSSISEYQIFLKMHIQ